MEFSRDPIINVVESGIKADIRTLLRARGFRGALLLTMAGIDSMASLGRPAHKAKVDKQDFIGWAEGYLSFGCANEPTAIELYGSRCGLLHAYETASNFSATGKHRQILYIEAAVPTVIYRPEVSAALVMVSITGLVHAFFKGIDHFLVDALATRERREITIKRFREIIHMLPADADSG